MHIGIDGRAVGTIGGIGRYARELISAVVTGEHEHSFTVFIYTDQPSGWIPAHARVVALDRGQKKRLPFIWEHCLLSGYIRQHGVDLMHFPNPTAPLNYSQPFVATVHDVSIFEHPEWHQPHQFISKRWAVPRTFRRARRLIAVSAAVREGVKRVFHVPDNRLSVVPNGVNTNIFQAVDRTQTDVTLKKYGIAGKYLLFVGTPAPYKNLRMIVEIAQRTEYQVVVVGPAGQSDVSPKGDNGIDNVVYTGVLPPDSPELVHLYNRAFLLIQPSLYESFGLPILEALACGTTAIVADIPSLRDIYHETVLYASPKKTDDWLRTIKMAEDDPIRENCLKLSKYLVSAHSWDRIAEATVRVYEDSV
ncbi:MAG: glycosyltransferase family 1 protein [Patescibacteria group bacterium]